MVYFIVDVWIISHGCPSFFLFLSVRHSNSGSLHGTQASEKFRRYKGVKLAALCLKERGQAQARTRRRIANSTHALISIMQAKILRTVQREQRRNTQRSDFPLSKMAWKRLWLFSIETWSKRFLLSSIRMIFVWPWKMVSVSVPYLFYQPVGEKIKTWPLRFPAKVNPNMEQSLFDWSIVLQY